MKKLKYNVRSYDNYNVIPKNYLPDLVSLYQEVFGIHYESDGSVWGEGAYCDKEGKSKKITIDDFRKKEVSGNLKCECGGKFIPYHPRTEILKNLRDSLGGAGVDKGRVCLLFEGNKLLGFSWGSLRTTSSTLLKLSNGYSTELKVDEIELIKKAIGNKNVLFFEEIAIARKHRGNSDNLLAITAPILALTVEKKTKSMIFRTYKKSRIYSFAKKMGFRVLVDKEDKPILYIRNIRLIFLWLQILGPKIMRVALRAANPVQ